jgi:hypothetical protein
VKDLKPLGGMTEKRMFLPFEFQYQMSTVLVNSITMPSESILLSTLVLKCFPGVYNSHVFVMSVGSDQNSWFSAPQSPCMPDFPCVREMDDVLKG